MGCQEKPEQKPGFHTATNWYTNMCETCADCFAACSGDIETGHGHGGDNVVSCDKYDSCENIDITYCSG